MRIEFKSITDYSPAVFKIINKNKLYLLFILFLFFFNTIQQQCVFAEITRLNNSINLKEKNNSSILEQFETIFNSIKKELDEYKIQFQDIDFYITIKNNNQLNDEEFKSIEFFIKDIFDNILKINHMIVSTNDKIWQDIGLKIEQSSTQIPYNNFSNNKILIFYIIISFQLSNNNYDKLDNKYSDYRINTDIHILKKIPQERILYRLQKSFSDSNAFYTCLLKDNKPPSSYALKRIKKMDLKEYEHPKINFGNISIKNLIQLELKNLQKNNNEKFIKVYNHKKKEVFFYYINRKTALTYDINIIPPDHDIYILIEK